MQAYGSLPNKSKEYTVVQAEDPEYRLDDDTDNINSKIESSFQNGPSQYINDNLLDRLLYASQSNYKVRIAASALIVGCGVILVFIAYSLIYPGYYFTFNTSTANYMGGAYVSTLAGSGSKGSDDGKGEIATFNFPFGVVLSLDESKLYVSDYGNNEIRIIDLGISDVTTVDTVYDWESPRGLLLSSNGDLYVADSNRISVIKSVEGNLDDDDGSENDAVDYDRIELVAGSSYLGDSDGIGSDARFFYPVAMTFNELETLIYVTDKFNGKVKTINLNSTDNTVDTIITGLMEPSGIAIDSEYLNLFVTTGTKEIFVYNLLDSSYNVIGSRYSIVYFDSDLLKAKFLNVIGLTIDNNNNLFVVDDGGHTIRHVDHFRHIVNTVAGKLGKVGYNDGSDTSALFSKNINLITINKNGTLIYIADSSNNRIRLISIP